jgi:hypothetical protein
LANIDTNGAYSENLLARVKLPSSEDTDMFVIIPMTDVVGQISTRNYITIAKSEHRYTEINNDFRL